MNLQNAFSLFETTKMTKEQKIDTINQLAQEINSPVFDFNKEFQTEKRYKRAFIAITAESNSLELLTGYKDSHYPAFFSHCLLIRMSHQIRFGEKDLENVATIVNKNTNSSTEPGTTLGYAVGYLIGKCLFLGEDCTSLIDICSKTVVLNYDIFKKGLHKGFSKSQGLMFDNVYVQNLNERYAEHWNEQSRDICYNAFKLMGTYKEVVKYENEHIDNPINEKMTWFLKGMFPKDDFINKLHLLHLNQVEQFSTKEFGNSPAFASMVQKTVKTKLAEETVKLKKQFEDDLNNIKNEYQVKLAAEVARIQQQAIDNAQQTLAEQAQINQHKRETEATKAVQHKIGRFL